MYLNSVEMVRAEAVYRDEQTPRAFEAVMITSQVIDEGSLLCWAILARAIVADSDDLVAILRPLF